MYDVTEVALDMNDTYVTEVTLPSLDLDVVVRGIVMADGENGWMVEDISYLLPHMSEAGYVGDKVWLCVLLEEDEDAAAEALIEAAIECGKDDARASLWEEEPYNEEDIG